MNFPPKSNVWHAGLLRSPIDPLRRASALAQLRDGVVWMPDPGPWRYLADPFGLWRGDALHVFVEAYDYRTKHAVIEHHEYGPGLAWRGAGTCLAAAVHLSFPFVLEHDGETFMVPESSKANELVLYRAAQFPFGWVREAVLIADTPVVDAAVVRHDGLWWMFHAIAGAGGRDRRELHLAWAERLTGPWQAHRSSPILDDLSGARPGGTPWRDATGALILPVQDCSRTYGGAIRFLRFATLTPDEAIVERVGDALTGDLVSDVRVAGFHTLSGCGDVTLFDAKQVVRAFGRYAIDLQRLARRALGRRPA